MDSLLSINLKSLIIFTHLSGLAFGVGGAWMLDIYILRKMYKSAVTAENIQIISFVSKLVMIGLALLWLSGIAFLVFYSFMQPELLLNHKIWAKFAVVIALSANGYYLHKLIIPLIENNQGRFLVRALSSSQINRLTFIGCISFISWPFVMLLGTFKSINFSFSFFEIIGSYLLILTLAFVVSFAMKNLLMEKEMNRKVRLLNEHLRLSQQELIVKKREIKVLAKVLKKVNK